MGAGGLGGGPGGGRGRLLSEEVGFIVAAMASRSPASRTQVSIESITFAVVCGSAVMETRRVMSLPQNQ